MARSQNSPVAKEAIERMGIAIEAESTNRAEMLEDLRFSHGEQWPDAMKMQRQLDKRPCLTINKTDTFVRSVVNNMRQQRPRIKVHPVSDGADLKKAELIEGLMRHIEVRSNAELAYDTASDYQVRMGKGYMRINADYVDEKSFDQELSIDKIGNPFSVYFDPASTSPDGLDAQWCILIDRIRKKEFEIKYPWATDQDFSSEAGANQSAWSTKEETMIAEYWRVEFKADKLFKMADGTTAFKSDLDEGKGVGDFVGNTIIIDARDSMKRVVKWSKITKTQELESREWPGRYIPIIPVYGSELVLNGQLSRFGMVRQLKDPQMMYNFWRTQETEFVALAPKAPWLVVEGQTENHEDEWATANIKNHSTLVWKPVIDENGNQTPPPTRISPQAIPAASVNAAMSASEDLKAVAGMFDPALGAPGQETSGTMVAQRQQQSDLSNYHFYDNLTRSIRAIGIQLLDLMKVYYSGERVIRIIGADGKPDSTTINVQQANEILNDLSVGQYDVVMETGPGYTTKRQEATVHMLDLVRSFPQLAEMAGDIIVGQMDWPGAQQLAERLAMANPLAKVQDQIPEDLDPKAKGIVGQLMGQLQQCQQQLEMLQKEKDAKLFGITEREKLVTDRDMMKEFAETQRTHLREDAHDGRNDADNQTWLHNTLLETTTDMKETMIAAQVDLTLGKQVYTKGEHKI